MSRFTRRAWLAAAAAPLTAASSRAEVAIDGPRFLLNGQPTYAGRQWRGRPVEGLLLNARLIQGIFDDRNPKTASRWAYPDTGRWDPDRNTREFVDAMPAWRAHGLLSFTIGMQGGSPEGYSKEQPWETGAFAPDGSIDPAWLNRLRRILEKADELGMIPIVSVFYFGQIHRLEDAKAIRRALRETVQFVLSREFRNVLIEVANECDHRAYADTILAPELLPLLLDEVRGTRLRGRHLAAGASFLGGHLPTPAVARASDFLLLHGNGVKSPEAIAKMVRGVRRLDGYTAKPVLFNEDDHFDFDRDTNHLEAALSEYAGWGYFDPEGFQKPPVSWAIDTDRKRAFFARLRQITGA